MSIEKLQKQTNANIQSKAALIWDIANQLYGEYKPHEYGRVILPMTVIKRFDDSLRKTKAAVLAKVKELDERKVVGFARDAILKTTAGRDYYNVSKFDFPTLLSDPDNIAANFVEYLQNFSDNVKDIISRFEFDKEIIKMSQNNLLYVIIQGFNSEKADMSPETVTAQDMGYIFEELVRKFSESYDEQAGAHFTSRDVIYLMTELLVALERDEIARNGCHKTAYDMTMGTSQMLACLDERLLEINPEADLKCYGQEFNPETFAIAKSDMLIKGKNAEDMRFGDTLSNDQFPGATFDYIISNPPFGIEWKKEQIAVLAEAKLGFDGRFGPGVPSISDGQLLFLLNGLSKLKKDGRMAIIQNGSSLFTGDAGSGPSEIRRYIIENDLLECIVQLPTDLFYNTGLSTYIWLITKNKTKERVGKVQLIDAQKCFRKRNRPIGLKKVDLSEECIQLIMKAYLTFEERRFVDGDDYVECKIFDNDSFGFVEYVVEHPLLDDAGEPVTKKGLLQPDKSKRDCIDIPLNEDPEQYFRDNVLPFFPSAWMDKKQVKIGYEIPFTRVFYTFVAPKNSNELLSRVIKANKIEDDVMEAFKNGQF